MTSYFAYGSNMDMAQMRHRCPSAMLISRRAVLDDHSYCIDRRGFASIKPDRDSVVYGCLWELTEACEASLDRYEGVRHGMYQRERVLIWLGLDDDRLRFPETHYSLTYISDPDPVVAGQRNIPNPGYQENVLAWSRWHQHPREYVRELGDWTHSGDSW